MSETKPQANPSFECGLRMLSPGGWEAQAYLPVVGSTSVTAMSWEEAKLKLWLISEALKSMERRAPKAPLRDWSDEEIKSTLNAMRDVLHSGPSEKGSPND